MMNNGLTFGMEGPVMEGTWYNANTGDSFTVRNSFFEDNQFIIQTTDGRVLGYNQIQNYIKLDNPINIQKQELNNTLPPEVAKIIDNSNSNSEYDILEDDMMMITGNNSLGNLSNNMYVNNSITSEPKTNPNYDIINKALTKRSLPDFKVEVDWSDCPIKEMNMLMDLMDITESEIIDWYLDQCDMELTTKMIKDIMSDHIYRQLHSEVIINTSQEPEIEQKVPKSKPQKLKKKE